MNQSDAKQYFRKTSQLSEETQFFLSSDLNAKIIGDLAKQYSVDQDKLNDTVADIIVADFDFSDLDNYLAESLDLEKPIAELLAADLIGRFFLPLEKYEDKIKATEALKKRKIDIAKYAVWQNALDVDLLIEADKSLEIIDQAIERIDWKEERFIAVEILNGPELADLLHGKEPIESLIRVNAGLIAILANDEKFADEAQRSLMNNDNILTKGQFSLNGKKAQPSVSNWIKDYISISGGDKLDSLALSRYISLSNNAKILTEADRIAVTKLLQLFFNLKFFPESMAGVTMEDWQVMYLGDISEFKHKIEEEKRLKIEMTENVGTESEPEDKLAKYDWDSIVGIERRALLEELGVSQKEFRAWVEMKK